MKYYKADCGTVKGPGGKNLQFEVDKSQISEEEFNEILDDFFSDTEGLQAAVVQNTKTLAWEYLHKGQLVTVDDVILSIKK